MTSSSYEQAVWEFVRQHQTVAVTIRYLDRNFDLVAEGIDPALCMGELPDSALRSRRLGSFERKLVCAPSYLKTLPKIETPDDLKGVDFVAMEGLANQVVLHKVAAERELSTSRCRLLVVNFAALRSALG